MAGHHSGHFFPFPLIQTQLCPQLTLHCTAKATHSPVPASGEQLSLPADVIDHCLAWSILAWPWQRWDPSVYMPLLLNTSPGDCDCLCWARKKENLRSTESSCFCLKWLATLSIFPSIPLLFYQDPHVLISGQEDHVIRNHKARFNSWPTAPSFMTLGKEILFSLR